MRHRLIDFCLILFCGMVASACHAQTNLARPTHVVSLGQAHKGSIEIDTLLLDSFGRLPNERRNFYLAARKILAASPTATPTDSGIIEAAEKAGLPLISGPMLGDVSQSGIIVWFRPVRAGALTGQVKTGEGSQAKIFPVDVAQPGAAVRVKLSGLPENTEHAYRNDDKSGLQRGQITNEERNALRELWQDNWNIPGREEIYNFIEENQIGGVLLLRGDRHGARGFRIERPSGFVLHEFEAATLGGAPGPEAFAPDKSAQIFGYADGLIAFGEFTFDMSQPDPVVTFRLIVEQGEALEKHDFGLSQLTPRK